MEIGDRPEWHLLKLFGVPVFADTGTRDGARFGEQRIRFRSTFNRVRFDAASIKRFAVLPHNFVSAGL